MSKFENEILLETRNRLVNEISLLNLDEFNQHPEKDKWSIAQVCQHLFLVEKAFVYAISQGLKNGTKAEEKNIHIVSDKGLKLKAPDIVTPDEKLYEVQEILDSLNKSRTKLLAVLATIDDSSVLSERSAKHPFFDDLPLNQWIELLYIHESRHIEQIKDLKLVLDVKG